MAPVTLSVATASRAYPGELVSGDASRVDRDGDGWRIAVIDGLGHGEGAAEAASAALASLSSQPGLDPAAALRQCHEALHGTRGAAMSIVSIDPAAGRLVFAGVGNVEARLWQAGQEKHISSARGIVGVVLPKIRPEELALAEGWRLVMHTDGVSARFNLAELAERDADLQALANAILDGWGRTSDDATVVVAGVVDSAIT
jgi:serine phosphatase RsbU (regulator of sigma subunit)